MSQKDQLIRSLQEDLPEAGLLPFVSVAIPALEDIDVPATTDDAIIAQGVLAANINTILQAFEGLTPVELLLRIGQRSSTALALLLASLECTTSVTHDFDIISPDSGNVYYLDQEIQVTMSLLSGAPACTSVSCIIAEAGMQFALVEVTDSPGDWTANIFLPLGSDEGDYTFSITAIFSDTEHNTTKDETIYIEERPA